MKRMLGTDVLTAARWRISYTFDCFETVCVSFSGGKDSSAMLHLVMDEAIRRGRKVGVLFIDLEAQYKLTIDHVAECFEMYRDHIEPLWVALPLHLRNGVSVYEPHWLCWEPGRESDWVRTPPPIAITDESFFPFFRRGMEFEEFIDDFAHWYGAGRSMASMVGIRTDESFNRWRTIASGKKGRFDGRGWTTAKGGAVYNVYPMYDWTTEDIWTYAARSGKPYNALYDRMQMAGVPLAHQRICQPYGDDQRRGLWLFHLIEPDTWARIVARVNGANSGALYVQETGNVMGNIKITCPAGHTWESFATLLLESMPPKTQEHYRNKIAVFLKWYADRGYPDGIPDEAHHKDEASRKVPSWRRVCKMLLRNDYWAKGLSFSQTKSLAYEAYLERMKNKRAQWNLS